MGFGFVYVLPARNRTFICLRDASRITFSYESTIQVNETLKIAQPLRFVASELGIVSDLRSPESLDQFETFGHLPSTSESK